MKCRWWNFVDLPPISVEFSVGEPQNFAQNVKIRMEEKVKEAKPDKMIWNLRKRGEKMEMKLTLTNMLSNYDSFSRQFVH